MDTTTNSRLPFLPGMTFQDPTRTSFHKSQAFNVGKDGTRSLDELKPGIGGKPLSATQEQAIAALKRKPETSADIFSKTAAAATASGNASYVPSWVDVQDQVLRFEAYFREEAPHTPYLYRIRRCSLAYYLEDDSMSVTALDHTTGRPQGMIVKRHRLPRPDGQQPGQHMTVNELNVGMDLTIYGRVYHIISADINAQQILGNLGITVGATEPLPVDPSAASLNAKTGSGMGTSQGLKSLTNDPSNPASAKGQLRKFLEFDKKILEFLCVWDDRASPYGDLRKFRLHYFLADDTIEILEDAHSARDRGTPVTFVKKQTTPKDFPALADMVIGSTVSVLNRTFLIYDVDGFTRRYFTEQFNVTDFQPIEIEERAKTPVKKVFPEYNGFGSEEDSLAACVSLIPKPPKTNMLKRLEFQGKNMQFKAVLAHCSPMDSDREFSVVYKLADDALQVAEVPKKGLQGGKIFEGNRVKNPAAPGSRPFVPQDLQVGAVVSIAGRDFLLTEAAEWTLKLMESRPAEWPDCDLDRIVAKLATSGGMEMLTKLKDAMAEFDKPLGDGKETGLISNQQFKSVMAKFVNKDTLSTQEVITICRRYDLYDDGSFHYPSFIGQVKALLTQN